MNVNNMLETYRTKKKDNSLSDGNAINAVHKYAYQRNSQRANELYTEAYQRSTSLDGTYRTAEETDSFYDGLINRYDSSNSAVLTSAVNKLNELRNSEKKFYSQFADPKSYYSSYAFSNYSDKSDDEIQKEIDRLSNLNYTNIKNEGAIEGLTALQQKKKNDAIKSMSGEEIENKLASLDMKANAYNDLNPDGTMGVKNTSFSNPYSMIALAESSPVMGGLYAKEADKLEAESEAAKEEAFTIRYLTDEEFKANVDSQIARKQELQQWWDDMEWYEQFGTWLGNSAWKGLSDASKGIMQSMEMLGSGLTGGSEWVKNGYQPFYDALGVNDQNYEDFITGMDDEFLAGLSNMTAGVVQSMPSTALAFMSGGSSAASSLLPGAQAATTSQILSSTFSSAAKNPSFWANVVQTLGPTYYNAIEDGASELDATIVALLNAGAGSLVEVGGGVETIPKGSASIKQWLKSMAEEGREEVIQGAIEASLGTLYKDVPIVSTDGSGIIDPNRAAQEFIGGAYGGALLGAGPMLINKLGGNAGSVDSQPESYLNNSVDYYEQQEVYDEALKNFQTYATPDDYFTSYSSGKATNIDENGNAVSYDTNNYARGLWNGAEEFAESFGQPTDVRYQLKGVNENGIEVYETSEKTKNLSLSEKKKALLNSVKNDFKGRNAKFTKDGETYYAQINDAGIRKGVYGDKKSSRGGSTAKLNIGADGNYFELLENSLYNGSSDEQGKTTNNGIHKKTSSWDYYVKTIESDGKLYDVLVNVADQGENRYVYDVTLRENEGSRPTSKANNSHYLRVQPTSGITTVTQNSGGVNGYSQKSTENSYFKSNPNVDAAKISEAVRSNSDSTAETQIAAAAKAIGYSPELSDYMQKTYEFSPNKDVEAFADNYNRIYLLARSGYLTESEANSWGGIVANIGFPAVNSAYNQGRLAYEADIKANAAKNEAAKAGQGKQKGGAKDTTGKADKSTVSALKQVGKKTGIKFRIVSEIDGRSNANGYYDSTKGEIVINVNAKNIVATAVHELTHHIRINSPEQYNELQDFVMNWVKSKNSNFLTAVLDQYKETYGSLDNMQDIIEEITADVSSELVQNDNFIAALITNVQFADDICAKKPTLAQKIFDFLEDLVESVKAFVKAHGSVSDMAAALAKDDNYQTLAKLEKLWSKALDSADENYLANESTAEGNGGVKYSLNKDFAKKYDEWDKKTIGFDFYIGTTSEVLSSLGVDTKKIYWDASKIVKIKDKHPAMTDNVIKQVPNILENPVIVMESKTVSGRLTLFGEVYDTNGTPVLAVLELNPSGKNGHKLNVIKIASAYGKDSNPQKLINESKILYISENKNVADTWLSLNRLQLPLGVKYGYNDSISQKSDSVNTSISEKEKKYTINRNMRFSLSSTSKVDYEALLAENAKLRKQVETLQAEMKITKGHKVKRSAVEKLAHSMCKQYSSKYDAETLTDNLEKIFNYMAEDGSSAVEAQKSLTEVAKAVIRESSEKVNPIEEAYGAVELPSKIVLSENLSGSLSEAYGSYAELKQACKGGIQIARANDSNSVTHVDSLYQELSEKYPSLFPENLWAEEDQFDRILEVSKLNRPVYVNKYKMDEDTHAAVAASELFDRYFDTPEVKTFADKQEAKLRQLQIESRNKIKAVKEEAKQRYEKKLAELKLQKDFKYEKLKEKQAEKIADLQVQFNERRYNEKIRRETTSVRNKIKGLMKYFDGCLRNPTERKYVPAYLYDAVLDVCRMVDLETGKTSADGSPTKAAEKLRALRDQYDKMKNDKDNPYFADAYDQSLNDELLEITELVRDKTVYQLTYGELNRLYELLKRVQHNVRTATKLIGDQKATDIAESGVKVIKEIRDSSTSVSKIGGWYQINTLNAERVARKASGYIKDSELVRLVKGLSDGELKAKQAEIEAQKYFEELIGRKKEFADFKGKTKNSLVNVGLKDENGNPLLITKEMRTALYLHSLNAQNVKHITYGGLSVPDLELYKRGKKVQAFNHCVRGRISADALANIASGMTQYELDFVKAAQKFFGEFSRDKINEVSMTLYGFKKANIDNYFPINSDKNFLNTEIGISVDSTLEGSGFLNKRVNSGNPIYLEGVADTVARHAERVSKLYGLAVPIRNFNKVYNVATKGYTASVRETMQKKWSGDSGNPGGYVVSYFDQYIKDLQGNQRGERAPVLDKLYGNLAQSVLSLKPSISAIQLSAYPNAASTLGFKSLGKALLKGGKNNALISRADRELIAKYTPLLEMRYDGDSTREISYAAKKENWASKVPWLMAWNQKVDIAVVGRIWSAAEYWVQEHIPKLEKGADEYYRAVAEKFNEAVLQTQANYTVSQRSAVMRSQNAILKTFTIYKTESMNTFGVLADAISDYNAQLKRYRQSATEENKTEVRRAGKKLARSVSGAVVSAMTYTVLKLIVSALMHRMDPYRDDEDNLTAESVMSNCGRIFLEQMGGLALFGGELTSIFEAIILKERYYGIENNQLSAISDLASSAVNTINAFASAFDSSFSDAEKQNKLGKASWQLAQNICSVFGVPLNGASQIAEGIVKHGQDIFNGEFFSFASDIELSKSEQLFEAYMNGDTAEYNRLVASYGNKSTAEGLVAKQLAEYDSRILKMAILHNDSKISEYDQIWKQMKAEGHDFDILMRAMNCAKNEISKTIKSIAEYRASGDTSSVEYRELMLLAEEYISMGMDNKELEKLVDEAQADIEEKLASEQVERTESAYEPQNIAGCLANGDTENAVRIYEELLEAKKTELVENGTDEDDAEEEAEAAMRSSLTSKLKPVYLELLERGDKTALREFENILVREFGYRRSTVRKWE